MVHIFQYELLEADRARSRPSSAKLPGSEPLLQMSKYSLILRGKCNRALCAPLLYSMYNYFTFTQQSFIIFEEEVYTCTLKLLFFLSSDLTMK